MINVRRVINGLSYTFHQDWVEVTWRNSGESWLRANLPGVFPKAPRKLTIEDRAWLTQQQGAQPIADIYGQPGAKRSSSEVRSSASIGDVFAWLAQARRPNVVVEFGAAFGISGMYWLAGLEAARTGHLYTFEINPAWAAIARDSLKAIGHRFTLIAGAFEECVHVVDGSIDIAFIDGVHTYEWVLSQYEILKSRASSGAIFCFDDINFRTGRMRECWEEIMTRSEVIAACELNKRVGIVQLR